ASHPQAQSANRAAPTSRSDTIVSMRHHVPDGVSCWKWFLGELGGGGAGLGEGGGSYAEGGEALGTAVGGGRHPDAVGAACGRGEGGGGGGGLGEGGGSYAEGGEALGTAVGGGQHPDAVGVACDAVLPVRAVGAVDGRDGPLVVLDVRRLTAGRDHRLDRQHQ